VIWTCDGKPLISLGAGASLKIKAQQSIEITGLSLPILVAGERYTRFLAID
jgi:hypothetical protein